MNITLNPFATSANQKPNCREMLQIILDGESTHEQRLYFKQHMDQCSPCFQSYEVDMAIKELLKTKCCGEAPAELIEEIKNKLNGQIKI
jgi:mycothiol system anti-sigma-R factor